MGLSGAGDCGKASQTRRFDLEREACVELDAGFSDEMTVLIDGEAVFSGVSAYSPEGGRAGRGYVELGTCRVSQRLRAG